MIFDVCILIDTQNFVVVLCIAIQPSIPKITKTTNIQKKKNCFSNTIHVILPIQFVVVLCFYTY